MREFRFGSIKVITKFESVSVLEDDYNTVI